MENVSQVHKQAMELADQALLARLRGETSLADNLIRQAFEKERDAAIFVANNLRLEPTRSVLHRSAASLAMECGEVREAERLISIALSGDPPEEIAEELRDLLEQVYFRRHLALRGITLAPDEFQLSLTGEAVGLGIAQSSRFIERVKDLETIIFRTAERRIGKPFQERGRRKKALQQELELFVSVPRTASFAVSFKIGSSKQLALPGIDFGQEIIDELFECFQLYGSSQMDQLRKKIPEPPYYRNFVGLARKIAPDGQEIRTVGFTAVREKRERQVILSARRDQGETLPLPDTEVVAPRKVQVRGTLRLADSRRTRAGYIELIDESHEAHRVRVPLGMMSDIVRPLFEHDVIVTGLEEEGEIALEDIKRTDI